MRHASTEAPFRDIRDRPLEEPLPELFPWDAPTHPLAPNFRDMRSLLRVLAHNRPRRERPRRRALLTMVHNESVFLPLWLRYYSQFFAPEDIYVLDNETTDGSTDREGFHRIPVSNARVDHTWMVDVAERHQRELLESYELVMVTDVDEIIALAPARGDLGSYLDRFDDEWVNCLGYELIHMHDREPPLRLDEPILDQRGWWYVNGAYDKAAIATVPMDWKPGFHGRTDNRFHYDPDVVLFHLHRMDYELCRQRHLVRSRKPWANSDARLGWASHNQVTGDDFEHWFYEVSGFEAGGFRIRPEPIPDAWRGAF
jgi:hypothetical protein